MCIKLVMPVRHTLSINEDVQYFIQFNIQKIITFILSSIFRKYMAGQQGSYLQADIKKNLESINLRLHKPKYLT